MHRHCGSKRSRRNISQYLIPPIIAVFLAFLIFYPADVLKAASKGLDLWLAIVLPSLFPFFVASDLLNKTYIPKKAGMLLEPVMKPVFNIPGPGSIAFILGIGSGYPVGAKVTVSLYKERLLNKTEGERLLCFSNNSGPVFIAGAIGAGMFGTSQGGVVLLICHVLAGISVGLLFRSYNGKKKPTENNRIDDHRRPEATVTGHKFKQTHEDLILSLADAVKSSILTVMAIGGYIMLFSVIIEMLSISGLITYTAVLLSRLTVSIGYPMPTEYFAGIIGGFFEITNGVGMVSKTDAPLLARLTAASIITGWGGLSVHSQVLGIISGTGLRLKPYLAGKALHAVIAGILTSIAFSIVLPLPEPMISPVSAALPYRILLSWPNTFLTSSLLVLSMAGISILVRTLKLMKDVREYDKQIR